MIISNIFIHNLAIMPFYGLFKENLSFLLSLSPMRAEQLRIYFYVSAKSTKFTKKIYGKKVT